MAEPDDLVAFIRVQVDEDERVAFDVPPEDWTRETGEHLWAETTDEIVAHVRRHDPARVLRDVEAKRRIIDLHRPGDFPDCRGCGDPYPCATAKLLALPYADRPGYRDEWRPR